MLMLLAELYFTSYKMNKDDLEKLMVKEFFINLDKAIVCPHQMCDELGKHFRCYDLKYENCSQYLIHKRALEALKSYHSNSKTKRKGLNSLYPSVSYGRYNNKDTKLWVSGFNKTIKPKDR